MFNEFKFSETTKAQIAGRIERVDLSGSARSFPIGGGTVSTPTSMDYTPKSASAGLIQNFMWDLVGSLTAQYVERAPKPAELFSGGGHDATVTFDKGNPNLKIEAAESVEAGLRRATGPFRFEATAYYTRFNGFIFRQLTGNTCDGDTAVCGPGAGDLNEAIYSQRNAIFRGGSSRASGTSCRLPAACSASRTSSTWCARPSPTGPMCRASRRCASAAACSGAIQTGSHACSCCTLLRTTRSRRSARPRRPAMTICAPNSATPGSRQSPGSTRSAK